MNKHAAPFVVVFFILVLAFSPLWVQAQTQKVRVVVESAELHLKPDTASQVISTVPLGAILELVLQKGDWYWVKLPPDQDGFVLSGYIHSQDTEVLGEKPTAQLQTAQPPPPPRRNSRCRPSQGRNTCPRLSQNPRRPFKSS